MNKEKLFYTIGEVAEELHLEQHVLRFWESQFRQIKPIKRKGRRLYDHKCIEVIKKIKYMLYDKGYTIKGVQKEFDNNIKSSCNFGNLLPQLIDLRDYLINKINSEKSNEQL
ncbi:MerR family transcriptional regulator [Wolbachia endosymbiont of Brugia malayi]|uniref:MerR family transcriptional regulator n=1 Tax=unclassified Wolbachia TaxID=2640676 RepID=UPI00004C94A0|nr:MULTISPECIES: MerR family transcriptional regulator [unclassified Wolbachia]AAW71248.1 Predicted transcriptional regulator [Wolbachia endosymbiont strain TRS of Brugia malayi]QCB61443.1 MerR family transcriptional regulator [Wolbachia endosymbiont of Brugia malayi]QIT35871.1 merR HTH regulatory family protein [Wolbachia endosymbiont of Brugia pahangi]